MRDDALIRDLAVHFREVSSYNPGRVRRLRDADEYEAIAPAISLPVEVVEATGVSAEELKRALLEGKEEA